MLGCIIASNLMLERIQSVASAMTDRQMWARIKFIALISAPTAVAILTSIYFPGQPKAESDIEPSAPEVSFDPTLPASSVQSKNLSFEGFEWSCVRIGDLTGNQNFFRAVGMAGDPDKWEEGPYLLVTGGEKTVAQSWDAFPSVYPGDLGCVTQP